MRPSNFKSNGDLAKSAASTIGEMTSAGNMVTAVYAFFYEWRWTIGRDRVALLVNGWLKQRDDYDDETCRS